YDLVEILNTWHTWTAHWDTALSHGHSVWLTANDDAHTITDLVRVQQCAVFIHAPSTGRHDILANIRRGAAFGVRFPETAAPTWEEKRTIAEKVSFPAGITVRNDTLFIAWEQPMTAITFTGDHGKVLAQAADTCAAACPVRPEDTYVRVTLEDGNGLVYYLNPVVRSLDGQQPPKQLLAKINPAATFWKRTVIAAILLLAATGAVAIGYKKRRNARTLLS
ncbi:MAG: hypothetical protein LBG31_02600, partial [Prevotellaceae bacterium]|nr:hypothetical protein [Prevotellaceae bacterium]